MKTKQQKKYQEWNIAVEAESEGSRRYEEDDLEEWGILSNEREVSKEEEVFMQKYFDESEGYLARSQRRK